MNTQHTITAISLGTETNPTVAIYLDNNAQPVFTDMRVLLPALEASGNADNDLNRKRLTGATVIATVEERKEGEKYQLKDGSVGTYRTNHYGLKNLTIVSLRPTTIEEIQLEIAMAQLTAATPQRTYVSKPTSSLRSTFASAIKKDDVVESPVNEVLNESAEPVATEKPVTKPVTTKAV